MVGGESDMGVRKSNSLRLIVGTGLACLWLGQAARAETVLFVLNSPAPPEPILSGGQVSLYVWIGDNQTELTGYSLNVDVTAGAGSTGMLTGNPGISDFFDDQNLIVQGGGTLHADSEIFDPGDGGLFVNALTADLMPVDLAGPGHDMLAELIFDVSEDALGTFTFNFGFGSILTDDEFGSVPTEWEPLTIDVIPEPAGFLMLAGILVGIGRKRLRTSL